MAYAGLMYTVSAQDGQPHYPLGAMSDVQAGTNLAFAALAGLIARDRTGEAQLATSSQLQTLMWMQCYNIAAAANLGRNFDSNNNLSPWFAIYPCRDGEWLALSSQKVDTEWPAHARSCSDSTTSWMTRGSGPARARARSARRADRRSRPRRAKRS